MQVNFKNLLVCSSVLFSCIVTNNSHADLRFNRNNNVFQRNNNQFTNNNQFINQNQVFNNNIAMHNGNANNNVINMTNFYSNPTLINNYLRTRISSVDSNGMKLNEQSMNNFDYQLFLFNIANSKSAKANIQLGLKSLLGDNFAGIVTNIFNFYFGNFKTRGTENAVGNNTYELISMIVNYYVFNIMNGNCNISTIQNNLQTLSLQQSWMLPTVLQNYGFQYYYTNYYLPRLTQQNLERLNGDPNALYFNGITLNNSNIYNWNEAINIIKQIDLAGCIKKLILGVNTGELLFNKELLNNNSTKRINPILLTNGPCQCWFNSSLQLVNSAVECSTDTVKKKLESNMGYVLVPFLKYLQDKSAKWFNNNKKSVDIEWNGATSSSNGLLLLRELSEFENILDPDVKKAWNSLPSVKEGKKLLKKVNGILNPKDKPIMSNASVAFAILEKIFPEINELYLNNWEGAHSNINNNNFSADNFIMSTINTDIDFFGASAIPDSLNPYFLTSDRSQNTSLKTQIAKNQYRIGYYKNGNLAIYTLKGMQLCYQGDDAGHFYTHAASDNKGNNWHFADSTGHNSNPNYKVGMFGASDKDFNPYKSKVQTFMYRKMDGTEILQYINQ